MQLGNPPELQGGVVTMKLKWRTYDRPPIGHDLRSTKNRPSAPSAYRVRFRRPGDGSMAAVLMARDATSAMRSAAELYPGEVLLGVRLLEQW